MTGSPGAEETQPALAAQLTGGDRRALARAITLVESTRPQDRTRALGLLAALGTRPFESVRIGISGAPGVGKSTFIEALGLHALEQGRRVAVLTVDPSSALSGGSILGDKTRMEYLARDERAFIRPSPSAGTLGGVARRTRETIALCEAAGFDTVLVETVGVGQSETAVADMTDMFVLLVGPGAGDELQGIKRGIMELADLVLVNKADGERADEAMRTASEYANALRLLRRRDERWTVPVTTCSALDGAGIGRAWDEIERHSAALETAGERRVRRARQAVDWMWREVEETLLARLRSDPGVAAGLAALEADVASGALPASAAAARMVEQFLESSGGWNGPAAVSGERHT